jgi:hypothetical protein
MRKRTRIRNVHFKSSLDSELFLSTCGFSAAGVATPLTGQELTPRQVREP